MLKGVVWVPAQASIEKHLPAHSIVAGPDQRGIGQRGHQILVIKEEPLPGFAQIGLDIGQTGLPLGNQGYPEPAGCNLVLQHEPADQLLVHADPPVRLCRGIKFLLVQRQLGRVLCLERLCQVTHQASRRFTSCRQRFEQHIGRLPPSFFQRADFGGRDHRLSLQQIRYLTRRHRGVRRGLLIEFNDGTPAFLRPLVSTQITIGRLQRAEQIPSIGHLQVRALNGNEVDLIVCLQGPIFFAQGSPSSAACQ